VKLWHIVAVVGVGIAFGFFEPGRLTYALSPVTLYVLLPALLFEAAWNLNYRAITRQWPAIATLAGPGVVLTILIVAGVLACERVPLGPAFLTGAILSATDPIAVVAVFRRIRVPKTLSTIIECESLFNDGVAVTAYQIVLAFLAIGRFDATAVGRVTAQSTAGVVGGLVLGVAIAFAAARALRGRSNPMLQIAATAAVAYGAYFAAAALSLAGVFATIAAGIAFRYYERRWIAVYIVNEVETFWSRLALIANIAVFFLVGAALRAGELTREPAFILATIAAVALSRFAVAGLLLPAGYPRAWFAVIHVAGLRGALCLALALSLPSSLSHRQSIIDATFAVVLYTLTVSSLTISGQVRRTAR
jgi:CPA1 family monovalent cation:H+ antiporter